MQKINPNQFRIPADEDFIYSVCTDFKTGIIISREFDEEQIYETIFIFPERNELFGNLFHRACEVTDSSEESDDFIFDIFTKMGYINIVLNEEWQNIAASKQRGIAKVWNYLQSPPSGL